MPVPAVVAPATVWSSGPRASDLPSGPSVEALAAASGQRWLDALETATPLTLRAADDDSRVTRTAMDDPPSTNLVANWWRSLSPGSRTVLTDEAPVVIGNLDGVPYDVRDVANRAALAAGLADPGTPTAVASMLGQVRESLEPTPDDPRKYLVTLDTRGTGRCAISLGDLDTAGDVSVVVPGIFFSVNGQMVDFTATAGDVFREQATLAPVAAPANGPGIAVVAWMGYRTPGIADFMSLDLAHVGADRLIRTLDGIRAVRNDHEPRLGVVAHSYGSTTAMIALSSGRTRVDSLTMLGSPGSAVTSVDQLGVPRGQVYVGGAHWDPVAGTGFFGTDPGCATFGAARLDLVGGSDPADAGDVFRRPFGHNEYLKPGTASLHDVALIAVGRGDLVSGGHRPGDTPGDGMVQATPDMYLVRPQDLQPRD
ncbi:alpha/beta hydrolase family protein [Curtobacterium herbarum]|uniref:alpha/beta hydrolase family protein n=1 Tax=Curtobacterium herbarum TaxID=150122 RepID=UPI00217E88F0|nr:alpha/beta hydrolase family protein [Curtobacterium herbarum]MCS6544271.1 alpha/beta hydrolase family protein [Curtobacterium herbarum]